MMARHRKAIFFCVVGNQLKSNNPPTDWEAKCKNLWGENMFSRGQVIGRWQVIKRWQVMASPGWEQVQAEGVQELWGEARLWQQVVQLVWEIDEGGFECTSTDLELHQCLFRDIDNIGNWWFLAFQLAPNHCIASTFWSGISLNNLPGQKNIMTEWTKSYTRNARRGFAWGWEQSRRWGAGGQNWWGVDGRTRSNDLIRENIRPSLEDEDDNFDGDNNQILVMMKCEPFSWQQRLVSYTSLFRPSIEIWRIDREKCQKTGGTGLSRKVKKLHRRERP